MLDVRGQPLLGRLVDTLKGGGILDITVVRGYRKEMVNLPTVKTIDNDQFATTGEVSTLACAADKLKGETLLAYGDVLFRQHILDKIADIDGDIILAVDALWRESDPTLRPEHATWSAAQRPLIPDTLKMRSFPCARLDMILKPMKSTVNGSGLPTLAPAAQQQYAMNITI